MKDNIYIKMLRFGKGKLEEGGFRYSDVIVHLKENGYPEMTETNPIVKAFFHEAFFSKDGSNYNHSSFFQIKPEAYFHLLEFDSVRQARKFAKQANITAIIAIVLTLASLIISIVK